MISFGCRPKRSLERKLFAKTLQKKYQLSIDKLNEQLKKLQMKIGKSLIGEKRIFHRSFICTIGSIRQSITAETDRLIEVAQIVVQKTMKTHLLNYTIINYISLHRTAAVHCLNRRCYCYIKCIMVCSFPYQTRFLLY